MGTAQNSRQPRKGRKNAFSERFLGSVELRMKRRQTPVKIGRPTLTGVGRRCSDIILRVLGRLLAVRYRLIWAQARTRRGKLAVFFTGYFLVGTLIVLMAMGGWKAARLAILTGQAELIARIVLGAVWVNALMIAVMLGIGVNPAFTDSALRRFPLSAMQRLTARHVTGALEPIWIVILALYIAVGARFEAFGVSSIWLSVPAALLLAVTNYLFARLVITAADRAGPIATGIGIALIMLPLTALGRRPGAFVSALPVLAYTPPFAAGSVMAGVQALGPLLLLSGWCVVLAVVLAVLDTLPPRSRAKPAGAIEWDGPCDRIARRFGSHGPLISKHLRYFLRSNRVRMSFLMSLPVFPILFAVGHGGKDPVGALIQQVWLIVLAGVMGSFVVAINIFGYDGDGFRRYFLIPKRPETVMQTASLVALAIGAAALPVLFFCFAVFGRGEQADARMWALLVSSGLIGIFTYQGVAVWTAILAPRRADWNSVFGNDLSRGANIAMMACIIGPSFILGFVHYKVGLSILLRYPWIMPAVAALALAFYIFTLLRGGAVLVARRERILAAVEGRQ